MNLRKTLSVTIVVMTLFITASASAKRQDSQLVLVRYDATVAGSPLASGSYKVERKIHSPEATVSFSRGNKVVATAEGKVVTRGTKYGSNEVVYDQNPDGSRVILELRFQGSSEVIVFNE